MTHHEAAASPETTMRPVFTIGHSARSFEEVAGMLRANGVTTLVDVRSFPSSRVHPQWNQAAIAAALPRDVEYRWIRDLGGRRRTPAGVPTVNGGWRVKAFRDYADYMATEQFRRGLEDLLAIARRRVPTIMCSEAVPWRCHRRLITDALIVRGIPVYDIMSERLTHRATLTPFAHVDGQTLSYPP